jgi:mRNA-degrading endonuclease RelE of RelBE toxin-antitoxin system
LDRRTRERILTAIEKLVESDRGDIRRLQGSRSEVFRLRVGGWRVLFSKDEGPTIVVRRVLPRGSAYQP